MTIFFKSNVDPRKNPVRAVLSGVLQSLPAGSIVQQGNKGQKFIKLSGNNLGYAAIPVTVPSEWNWSAEGAQSWKILQDFDSNTHIPPEFANINIYQTYAPTAVSLSKLIVLENETLVGTLTATDADVGDTHTFAISGGVDANSFEIINTNILQLKIPAIYASKSSYALELTATDSNGATKVEQVTISVSSIPTSVQISSQSVLEEKPINYTVGTLSGVSPDGNQSFSYSIVAGDVSHFNIQGNVLRTSTVFDYEVKSSYTITVRATNIHGQYVDSVFVINIQQDIININENKSNDYVQNKYTQYGLQNIFNLTPYPTTGRVVFQISNYRNNKDYPYGSFQVYIQYTKNLNNYSFSYILPPAPYSQTKDEDGNTIPTTTYPAIPNDFSFNITNAGMIQIFIPTYNEPNITSAFVTAYVTDEDNLFYYEKKRIYLTVDPTIAYSLQPGVLDNDAFEIIDAGYTIQFKQLIDYETKSTYQIALTQTKDSVSSTYIRSINVVDKDDSPSSSNYYTFSKKAYVPTQVWYASTDLLDNGVYELSGCGEQNATLAFGGRKSGTTRIGTTQKFNGSAWTMANDSLRVSRSNLAGCGTQNAALAFGGVGATQSYNTTEKFDGNTWTQVNNMSALKFGLGGCGTQNAALAFGGYSGSVLNVTETYDGSNWITISAILSIRRYNLSGCGTQNAALATGGNGSSSVNTRTEKFDGSTWSTTTNAMSGPRVSYACGGTQNAAVMFGGYAPTTSDAGNVNDQYNLTTQIYNGDTWTAASPLLRGRRSLGGAGQLSSSLSFGGLNGSTYYATVEKFNGNVPYSNLENPTLLAANLNSLVDKDTNPAYLTNVFSLNSPGSSLFEIKNGSELHLKSTTTPPSGSSIMGPYLLSSEDVFGRKSANYFYVNFSDNPIGPSDFNWNPTSNSGAPGTVAENKPTGSLVGILEPVDANGLATKYYYSIVGGDGMGKFWIFNQQYQGIVYTSEVFDYEVKSSYTLQVRCTDISGYWFEKPINVSIVNVAE